MSRLFFSALTALSIVVVQAFAADGPDVSKSTGKIVTPKPLSLQQQEQLLARRLPGSMAGTLNSYTSLVYAVHGIILHDDEKDLGEVMLTSPFPDFYKPTGAELFNAIGRQTGTTWAYDAKRAYWLFSKPGKPMPFKITLAKGWVSEERGNYLWCKPPSAPIGMDVYVMAEYSGDDQDKELEKKMREASALMFAKNFKKDVTAADMKDEKIGADINALYFKVPTSRKGATWRQWAVAERGQVIVIVSVIDDDKEKEILPDVLESVKSFEVK